MPTPKRLVIDGKLRCSKCKADRPVIYFWQDRSASSGRMSQCQVCLKGNNKVEITEPDYDTIPTSRVKRVKRSDTKIMAGGWERVVRHAKILTPAESVRVWCGKDYYSHASVAVGILEAARRMRVRVHVEHGIAEVYVRNHWTPAELTRLRGDNPRAATGLPD